MLNRMLNRNQENMQVRFHSGLERLFDGCLIFRKLYGDKLLKISSCLFDRYLIMNSLQLVK